MAPRGEGSVPARDLPVASSGMQQWRQGALRQAVPPGIRDDFQKVLRFGRHAGCLAWQTLLRAAARAAPAHHMSRREFHSGWRLSPLVRAPGGGRDWWRFGRSRPLLQFAEIMARRILDRLLSK